uniref:ribonuclease H n=1 Tax=Neogobius melanostomus TaxID=47308 RepID=A0A8C6TVK3_9GOBI
MSECPVVEVNIGGINIPCLLDTGSMVSTITEEFFIEHFQSQGETRLRQCNWLQLKAANGLGIPYIGYLELEVHVLSKTLQRMGILVVKSPADSHLREKKRSVPGLLGMNIIRPCYHELFVQLGPDLFNSPALKSASPGWKKALTQCQSIESLNDEGYLGIAKVTGRPVCIPAGSLKFIQVVCPKFATTTLPSVLLEPLDKSRLPAGVLISKALLMVQQGIVQVPVVNVGSQDAWLRPYSSLGSLHVVQTQSYSCSVTLDEQDGGKIAVVQSSFAVDGSDFDIAGTSWPMLSSEEEQQGKALLAKYAAVFSKEEGDIGCTNLVEHEVPLLDDAPVRQRYRRLPPSQYEQVKAHIQELLNSGIIQPSSSPYASPIVIVQKKDGSMRLCVDYRLLNAKTRKDAYPLPRIEESLDALGGARWFSTLDLASGYNQVPIAEKDKAKTAFCTPFGLFEFNRMPFGLCNAPSTFQRLMERIFGDQSFQSLLLYLDDIIIFSSSFHDHLQRLELVLARLQEHNLKLKLKKCQFFQSQVKYLGHIVSSNGVATDPEKISVVEQWKRPTTATELQSFLGFASYYRRFVEGFSKFAAPLHRLVADVVGSKHKPKGHG